jgi:hypothetical protein
MAKDSLDRARSAKDDEFYTSLNDVGAELLAYHAHNPNLFKGRTVLLPCDDPEWSAFTSFFVQKFDQLGLHKLISTSYNPGGCGKVFTVKRDLRRKQTRIDDLEWSYLEGDGDFRSAEVTALRDEADFIITNPPFSLFREFLAWIRAGGQQFALVGNKNAITYKEVFPLIQADAMWVGFRSMSEQMWFQVPNDKTATGRRAVPACWFTNIDHGKRHDPLNYMTQADNLKFNPKLRNKRDRTYVSYNNFEAIEVPVSSAIPSDYAGVMGVPITYLNDHCPDRFKIVGFRKGTDGKDLTLTLPSGEQCYPYCRVLIRAI